jgi:hypothetical protein
MLTPQISAFAEQAAAHLSQFALKTARAQATSPANWPPAVTAIRSLIFSISSSSDETHTTAAPASPMLWYPRATPGLRSLERRSTCPQWINLARSRLATAW